MKNLTEYDRVTCYIDSISELIRNELFEGKLTKPIITLQKTTGAYGHFETVPMWQDNEGNKRYEINLGSETITRPIEQVVATLIHEYTHYYNHINGVKDCSRGGTYHNKKFKEEAEKHMIHIEYDSRIGFSPTTPTDELIQWCIEHDLQDIKLGRGTDFWALFGVSRGIDGNEIGTPKKGKRTPKPSSTIKYICPECKTIIRATRNLDGKIHCNDCDVDFERS